MLSFIHFLIHLYEVLGIILSPRGRTGTKQSPSSAIVYNVQQLHVLPITGSVTLDRLHNLSVP